MLHAWWSDLKCVFYKVHIQWTTVFISEPKLKAFKENGLVNTGLMCWGHFPSCSSSVEADWSVNRFTLSPDSVRVDAKRPELCEIYFSLCVHVLQEMCTICTGSYMHRWRELCRTAWLALFFLRQERSQLVHWQQKRIQVGTVERN